MSTWRRGGYEISDSAKRIDVDAVHGFLTKSYWAKGIPRRVVHKAIRNSLCFGVFQGREQVGFARVVTDHATFGYLADVFVVEDHRGKGLSKWLMRVVMAHPKLQGFRRWVLVTRDAHSLYTQNGFTALAKPEMYMEKWDPEVYTRVEAAAYTSRPE